MRIHVENLGAIRYAEMEMGKFTIICGMNNSGKTYVTYAIYGFLYFWRHEFDIQIEKAIIKRLKNHGILNIQLNTYIKSAQEIINQACAEYTKILPSVYSAQEKLFENTTFKIFIESDEIKLSENEFHSGIKTSNTKSEVLTLYKDANRMELTVTLFSENSDEEIPDFIISNQLSDAIKETVFSCLFPNVFIASAERTGAAKVKKRSQF